MSKRETLFESKNLLKKLGDLNLLEILHNIHCASRSLTVFKMGSTTLFYCESSSNKSSTLTTLENFDDLESLMESVKEECQRAVLAAKLQYGRLEKHQRTLQLANYQVDLTVDVMRAEDKKADVIPATKTGANVRWLEKVDGHICSIRVVILSYK